MSSEAQIFVGIPNVVEIRKDLLTASKDSLQLLKNYEEYKVLRTQKLQHVIKLYKILSNISLLNKQLRSALPKIESQIASVPISSQKQVIVSKSNKSKLEILEDELEAIEARLGALG